MTRSRLALVLAVLGLAALVTAVVLVRAPGHQTMRGSLDDPDDDALAETTTVRVECSSTTSGPRLTDQGFVEDPAEVFDGPAVAEDDGSALAARGIDVEDVSDVCGRVRVERLAHGGELTVAGFLLLGAAVGLSRQARRREEQRAAGPETPEPPRRADGAVLQPVVDTISTEASYATSPDYLRSWPASRPSEQAASPRLELVI